MSKKHQNLTEFYPFYLMEHRNFISRCLHFVGTAALLIVLFWAIISQNWAFLGLCPVLGYGFAWVGHFFFEKNRPATFTYPAMSLVSDFIMFYHILTFQITAKMQEAEKTIKNKS